MATVHSSSHVTQGAKPKNGTRNLEYDCVDGSYAASGGINKPSFSLPDCAPGNSYRYVPTADVRPHPLHKDISNNDDFTGKHLSTAGQQKSSLAPLIQNTTQSGTKFSKFEDRLQSFPRDWKYEYKVPKTDLARYGWVCQKTGDSVMCFSCHGRKQNWKHGETPLGEHKRLFPNCKFLINCLKDINSPIIPAKRVTPDGVQSNSDIVTACITPSSKNSPPTWIDNMARLSLIQLDMYPEDDINTACTLLEKQKTAITTDNLYELLSDPKEMHKALENISNKASKIVEKKSTDRKQRPHSRTQPGISSRDMQKESEQYKNRTMCKVCLDQMVGVVFLPCKHLICCTNCADNVVKCPCCRAHIAATIKAFI